MCAPPIFFCGGEAEQRKNFFCLFCPKGKGWAFFKKRRKKVRKTALGEMTGAVEKGADFTTLDRRKRGKKKLEGQMLNKLLTKKRRKFTPQIRLKKGWGREDGEILFSMPKSGKGNGGNLVKIIRNKTGNERVCRLTRN